MTMRTTTPEVDAYLAAVRDELSDLPETDRAELLDDLAHHLAEVADTRDEDELDESTPLRVRLGSPADYASELRAAAGLPPRTAGASRADATTPPRSGSLWASARAFATTVWTHPLAVSARAFARELTPAWWLARGFLAVSVAAWWTIDAYEDFPIPTVFGSQVFGAMSIAAAMAVSVWLGRRDAHLSVRVRALVRAAEVAIVGATLVLLPQIDDRLRRVAWISDGSSQPMYALQTPNGPVTNIYPYAADGTPLDGVLLFDQDGRPLRTEPQQWWADGCPREAIHPRAVDGVPVDFSYPHDYQLLPQPRDVRACFADPPRPSVPVPTAGAPTTTTPPAAPGTTAPPAATAG
ncbi:MAG TPA: hypothetical protein VF230_02440 [Acidimicrobiales bacterium]